jgi:hypothetical protein
VARFAWCVGSVLVAGAAWLVPFVPLWVATGATGFAVGALLWFGFLGADSWIEGGILAVILAVLGAILVPAVERVRNAMDANRVSVIVPLAPSELERFSFPR